MTNPNKELHIACNYLLRLIKAHVQLTAEQIHLFKRTFFDILSKRYVNHWFPATPNRGSAYRCLQTKHWNDPILRSIAERCCLPLHRYLPAIFTMWIDPGEVAVCFGDEGTWCPLYNQDMDDEYSDDEQTISSLSSDDDLIHLTKQFNLNQRQIQSKNSSNFNPIRSSSSLSIDNSSRTSSPYLNAILNHDETSSIHISWSQ